MDLTKFSIIFILIIIPFLVINYVKTERTNAITFKQEFYTEVIKKATEDATYVLKNEASVNNDGNLDIDEKGAVEAFINTICLNLNITDDYEKNILISYIPLIIVVDYDGIYTFSLERYNDSGTNLINMVEHEKKYFLTTESDKIISMCLNDYYYVTDRSKNITFQGTYDELKAINVSTFFDKTKKEVETYKQIKIMDLVEKELLRINSHNEYAAANGVNYEFFIPTVKGDAWSNTIENIGIVAVIQGLPMGVGSAKFNLFNFSASGVEESKTIEGYNNFGKLQYHEDNCTRKTGTLVEIFNNEADAAKADYYPCIYCH